MKRPLNVKREDFPKSTAGSKGMIPLNVKKDNYEIHYHKDVEYVKRGDHSLKLQILLPIDRRDPAPLIVHIPGSAFHKQDVIGRVPQLGYLVKKGYAVALLEYRPSEEAVFPAQTLDAKEGVCFMREHASQYGIDPEKIFLMGDSSGGHTALMAGVTHNIPELTEDRENQISSKVKGIIDFYGPTNFATMNDEDSTQDHTTSDSPEGFLIGQKPILKNPDLVRPTVIMEYITKDREIPPILMFHGTNDELVPFGQSCELSDALQRNGKDYKFYAIQGAHHGGREFWCEEVLNILVDFIES